MRNIQSSWRLRDQLYLWTRRSGRSETIAAIRTLKQNSDCQSQNHIGFTLFKPAGVSYRCSSGSLWSCFSWLTWVSWLALEQQQSLVFSLFHKINSDLGSWPVIGSISWSNGCFRNQREPPTFSPVAPSFPTCPLFPADPGPPCREPQTAGRRYIRASLNASLLSSEFVSTVAWRQVYL